MTRDELIEAGNTALDNAYGQPLYPTEMDVILDAVEPLIRADLCAKVEALEDEHVYDPRLGSCVLRSQVLALLDGSGE